MRIEMKSFACVAAVCCASLSLCAYDSLPVSESFETDPLAAEWSGDGVISNMEYMTSGSVGRPLGGDHAKVLWIEGSATRTYSDSNSQKRTVDFMVMAESLPDDDLPAPEGDEQFRLAFDTNGCINLFHGYSGSSRWTAISAAYPSGTWVRVTLNIEYPSSDARASCQVVVNGSPCVTEYGYRESSLTTAGGSWYQAATNGMKLASVDFTGVGGVDDLILANSPDYLANYPGGQYSTNDVQYAWLVKYGISADSVGEKACDASAYTAKQAFDAGIDPYSSTLFYVTNATFSSDNLTLTFNGYKGETPSSCYDLKSSTAPITPSNAGTTMSDVTFGTDGQTTTATVAIPTANTVTFIQAVAHSGSVATTNQFGILKVLSTNADTVVSAPWVALDANVEDPAAIKVSKLVKTTNLTAGDVLVVFDGTNYKSWVLNSGCTEWEPVAVVASDSPLGVALTGGAAATTLVRGQGVLLHRQNPTDGSGNARPFYLYGQYTSAPATTTVAAGATMLLANPNPAASFNFSAITPGAGDKIVLTGSSIPKVYTYEDSAWGYEKTEISTAYGLQVQTKTRVTNESSVEAGKGFWYKRPSGGSGNVTINW